MNRIESDAPFSMRAYEEQIEQLEKYYLAARHYSQHDLREIGKDIGVAIYHFSNLSGPKDNDGTDAYRAFGHLSEEFDDASVPILGKEYIHRPLLAPAVFSVPALEDWIRVDRAKGNSKRALSEISIRKELDIELPRSLGPADTSDFSDFYFQETESPALRHILSLTEDEESQGSDSDPSGDELPLKEVLRQGGLKKVLGSDSEIMKVVKIKRKAKKSKRPSSASAAWVDSNRRASKVKLVRSLSATATRRPLEMVNQSVKAAPSLPSGKNVIQQSNKVQKQSLRTYEKSNYSKATENALRRQASEQFVILPSAGFIDSSATFDALGLQRLSSDESLDIKRGRMPQRESKVTLRQRGIFFPDSGRHF